MKDFNIYLTGHDKAYSITLNNRLTECDIIIRSIAFRDGFSVDQAFVLDTEVLGTLLQNFFSASSSCVIQAESEGELKTVFESASPGFTVCAAAAAMLQYIIFPESIGVEISTANIPLQATVFEAADNGMEIQISIPEISYFISLGRGETGMQLDAEILGEQKQVFEHPSPSLLLDADVKGTQKTSYESVSLPVFFSAVLPDIFYALSIEGQSGFMMGASLDDICVVFPFGCLESTISIAAQSLGEHVQKMEAANAETVLSAFASMTSLVSAKPSSLGISLKASVDSIEMRRYRSLGEIDPFLAVEIDQKSLRDLSYIVS